MQDSQQRTIIKITFPIIITLYTFLIYMIILVLTDNENIDYWLFSIIIIIIGSLIVIFWRFLPITIKFNFVAQKLYGGFVNGESFLNNVTNIISLLTIFIGVIIGGLEYIF